MTVQITFDQIEAMLKCRFGSGYKIKDTLHQNARFTQRQIIQSIADNQGQLDIADIRVNRFRVMHFMSQTAHEADQYRTTREYHDGSNYEGRTDLGNMQPGDGKKYRGRGIIQLTGRYNYQGASDRLGIDFINNPDLAEDLEYATLVAADFWAEKRINRYADGDKEENIRQVTKVINGGYNGYDDRKRYFMCAGTIWTADTEPEEDLVSIPRKVAIDMRDALNKALMG